MRTVKTLIRAAEAQHRRVHHGFAGIPASDGRPDWSVVRVQKDELVSQMRQAKYSDVLRSHEAVTLFEQRGVITAVHGVRLADGRTIGAAKILVSVAPSQGGSVVCPAFVKLVHNAEVASCG
jgi:hypothetical protein